MDNAFIEVSLPDGTVERFPIEGSQVTLGKSGEASISIPTAAELELEHLLLAPRGKEGCWVSSSQGALTPTLRKGKSFTSGIVPWGGELTIGRLKVKVTNKQPKAKRETQMSPIVVLGGLGIVASTAWIFLQEEPGSIRAQSSVEAPALFAEERPGCPESDTPNAEARALEHRADRKADRVHYDRQDGVEAVTLYGQAEDCLRQVGTPDAVSRAGKIEVARARLEQKLVADLAMLRLRLERALDQDDYEQIASLAEGLDELFQHVPEDHGFRVLMDRYEREARAEAERARRAAAKKDNDD
ncbi:MAG: hypothetical protein AAF447_25690 [Myxococcota bacterium]